jgi:hypothetical protein
MRQLLLAPSAVMFIINATMFPVPIIPLLFYLSREHAWEFHCLLG